MPIGSSVYDASPDGHISATYGACPLPEDTESVCIHGYAPEDVEVTIYIDEIRAGSLKFNTGDYDKPVSVYRLVQTDPEKWLMAQLKDEERDILEALSPVLQEHVRIRVKGISLLTNQINARRGAETLSVSAALQALLDKPELETEEPEYYLFVFKKGVPVLVTYSWHHAGARFCVLESAETESAESLQECMKAFGLEVIPVDIP
jgi:hypothetical protein